ncbi:uncharacterized protein LOC122261417 isoform X2 [Penaeus japonicus]|uniref:uncharacterized protein LOC122261417 isoform X2 n=2 Tax=Penaeus japonicus TaxID=27405 RepID=UPI001C71274A|nr:uncharacterized protein LOC122261417 isoform X2 [Penaeus japonicus]
MRQIPTSPLYVREAGAEKKIQIPTRAKLSGLHGKIVDITGLGTGYNKVPKKSDKTSILVDNIARESLIQCSENTGVEKQGKGGSTSDPKEKISGDGTESRTEAEDKNKLPGSTDNEKQVKLDKEVKSGDNIAIDSLIQSTENIELEKPASQGEGVNASELEGELSGVNASITESRKEPEDKKLSVSIDNEEQQEKSDEDVKSTEECKTENVAGNPSHYMSDPLVPVFQVERAMKEWMSFDSLRVILGDSYVRGMLEDFGHSWQDYDTTAGLKLGIDARAKYIALCRKLDQQELQEEKEILHLDEEDEESEAPKKSMPDYEQLKKDAKKQQLKVVSFLGGRDQYEEPDAEDKEEARKKGLEPIPEEQTDTSKSPRIENASGIVAKKGKGKKTQKTVDKVDIETSTLPLIDSYSQLAWRQQIVMEKTRNCLNEILGVTDLDGGKVRQLLRALVTTLDLEAHNISFRPGQWNLIMMIFMELIGIRYPVISAAMKTEKYYEILENILSAFSLDTGYMTRIVTYLTEIQPIISKNFSNNTGNQGNTETPRIVLNQDAATNNQENVAMELVNRKQCESEDQISKVNDLAERIEKLNVQEKSSLQHNEAEQSFNQEESVYMKSTLIEELD